MDNSIYGRKSTLSTGTPSRPGEAWIHLTDCNEKLPDLYISRTQKRSDVAIYEKVKHAKRVMASIGISSTGMTKIYFIKPGTTLY